LLDKRRPERRPAQTPEGFVEEHQLISNMQLDVARCRAVFMAQLGRPLNGWKSLAPHEKTCSQYSAFSFSWTIARQQKR
jgi:intracellular multiplication protein IcmP